MMSLQVSPILANTNMTKRLAFKELDYDAELWFKKKEAEEEANTLRRKREDKRWNVVRTLVLLSLLGVGINRGCECAKDNFLKAPEQTIEVNTP